MFLRLSQGCWPVGWPLRPVPPGAAGVPSKVSEALGADSRVPGWLATGTQVLLEPVWSSVTVCPVAGVPEACFLAGSTGWSPTPSFTQQYLGTSPWAQPRAGETAAGSPGRSLPSGSHIAGVQARRWRRLPDRKDGLAER